MEAICSSETSTDLHGLHGVASQRIELFTDTAVRTSNAAENLSVSNILQWSANIFQDNFFLYNLFIFLYKYTVSKIITRVSHKYKMLLSVIRSTDV
jgi:hypothetical protein